LSLRFEEDELIREKLKIEEKNPDDRTKREINRLEEISNLLKKKIISITMSQAIISKIDKLKNQIGRSRAQLIEDAVRWYLDFTVHKWTPRSIFLDSIRMVLESESLLSLFFSKMTPVDQYELGKTAGKKAPIEDIIKIFHGKDVKNPSSRELVFQLMQDKGWGSFRQQNDLLIIENPFYPPPFLKGYIETLLGIDLELVETNVKDNVIFKLI
jgi:hypothetical protein